MARLKLFDDELGFLKPNIWIWQISSDAIPDSGRVFWATAYGELQIRALVTRARVLQIKKITGLYPKDWLDMEIMWARWRRFVVRPLTDCLAVCCWKMIQVFQVQWARSCPSRSYDYLRISSSRSLFSIGGLRSVRQLHLQLSCRPPVQNARFKKQLLLRNEE